MRKLFAISMFILGALAAAHADVALLLEEPHGFKAMYNPTGHAAVYLTEVCADSPTHLRLCQPGEGGVVISRYKKVGGYDWLAIPLLPYLYAVESIEEIPQATDEQTVAALRDRYRRAHLLSLVPDSADGNAPKGDWVQLVGAAYVRKVYGFEIETTPEQDAAFIEKWNQRENRNHFNIFYSNCANFAAGVLNFYAPHSVHRNYLADAGIMTPKQVAKSLARHARRHPALEFSAFQIPQVPGSIPRSKRVDGVAETVVKSKKYVVPLAIVNPALTGSLAVAYFTRGRFDPKRDAGVFDIARAFRQPQARNGAEPIPPDGSGVASFGLGSSDASAGEVRPVLSVR
jgi:hypothetical protein